MPHLLVDRTESVNSHIKLYMESRSFGTNRSTVKHADKPVNGNGNRFYSPLVLNIAKNEGIPLSDLEKIPGSGNEGRVTKKDILSFVSNKKRENGFQSRSTRQNQHMLMHK